jgi:hypothetical protein
MREPRHKFGDIVKQSEGILRGIEQVVLDIKWDAIKKRYICLVCSTQVIDPMAYPDQKSWWFEEDLVPAGGPLPEEVNKSFTNKITGEVVEARKAEDGSFRWNVRIRRTKYFSLSRIGNVEFYEMYEPTQAYNSRSK